MAKLYVIKIGGQVIDNKDKLTFFLNKFAAINEKKILVHGGGRLATDLSKNLGIPAQLIDGRRVTDAKTLKIVTMVYAGLINKNIVAQLQAYNCNAIGLTGADGNVILAHKRNHPAIDYGFAGDVDLINTNFLSDILARNMSPVLAPITHDKKGQLLNTNADTIAQEVARSMSTLFEVELIYSFEKEGVLLDAEDETTVISQINPAYFDKLKSENKIFSGMIPKLDNAFAALQSGVKKVKIGKAENIEALINGSAGTSIINEH